MWKVRMVRSLADRTFQRRGKLVFTTAKAFAAGPFVVFVFVPSLKGSIPKLTLIFHPNDQTLKGRLSAVSTPNFARKYSLESSWRDLQDLIIHAFAPLRPQYFRKISSNFFAFFGKISNFSKFRYFRILFIDFCSDFYEILSEFRRYFRKCWNFPKFQQLFSGIF